MTQRKTQSIPEELKPLVMEARTSKTLGDFKSCLVSSPIVSRIGKDLPIIDETKNYKVMDKFDYMKSIGEKPKGDGADVVVDKRTGKAIREYATRAEREKDMLYKRIEDDFGSIEAFYIQAIKD